MLAEDVFPMSEVTRCRQLLVGAVVLAGTIGSHLAAAQPGPTEQRIVVSSRGWELIGDLMLPAISGPPPAVLMLNKAAGDRNVYRELAEHLAERHVASLRLDLPGHGESTNLGRFVPGERDHDPMIWDAEVEINAAHQFLKADSRIDPARIAIVGASYSGEEMAEAGRVAGYAQAYVALSPGSFSDESIEEIDASGVPWLLIVSRDERYLKQITVDVQSRSKSAEILILPGTAHASDLLARNPGLSERIAIWLSKRLIAPCIDDPTTIGTCDVQPLH